MANKTRIRVVVDEDPTIIQQLDTIAEREGITRSDVLRRAIRGMLFSLPKFPACEKLSIEGKITQPLSKEPL